LIVLLDKCLSFYNTISFQSLANVNSRLLYAIAPLSVIYL